MSRAGVSRPLLVLASVLLAALVSGCGYTTDSLLPGGSRRIAVEVHENTTFFREHEFTLQREVMAELRQRSHYRVSRRRDADVLLEGEIVEITAPTLVETRRDLVSEQAVIVTARFRVIGLERGTVLSEFTIRNRAEFVVERGEDRQDAFSEALRDLAEDTVNRLEHDSFLAEMGYGAEEPPE